MFVKFGGSSGEAVIWRISRCLDSNICWNSGRKYSNGGFVALARPTQRVASVRGKRGEIFCFENLNFYSWNDYFKHLAHGLGWLVCSQFVFHKFPKLGGFRVLWCIPPTPLAKYLGGVSEVLAHYAHFFFLLGLPGSGADF